MKRRNAILLFGLVAIIAMIAIVAAAEREDNGTRAGETYLGDPSGNCNTCHSVKVANWTGTDHADADGDFQDKHGTNVYESDDCGPCHVLGWNETAIDGFDPGQAWNTTYNEDRWMIQCENCHGPASGHLAAPMDAASKIASINLDRDQYTSCYGYGETGCHGGTRQWGTDEIPGWNASAHAPWENSGGGLDSACAKCKSPSQYNPDVEIDYTLEEWRGITCGDCHNPHNDTGHVGQLRWDEEEVCEECHNEGHQTIRNSDEDIAAEGVPSVDRDDYPYMEEESCVECHMFTTGRSVPEPWKVIGHSFEPTIEACISCHTDVYDSLPDVTYNETNMAEWDAWEVTLDEALEEWKGVVDASQARYDELIEEVEELYVEAVGEWSHGHVEAPGLMQAAEENGTWTDDLDAIATQAMIDFELADHASRGAHNPAYATALLNAAKEGFEEIIEELHKGKFTGYVTDESDQAVEGAYITVNGHGTTTDSAGMYSIMMEPGTYTISAFILGTEKSTETGLAIDSAEVVVQNFTLAPDFDRDGTADETDTDDDNDGVLDADDFDDADPTEWTDTDGNGVGNNADTDDDGDGVIDTEDTAPLDETVTTKIGEGGDDEEADTTMYLVLIIVLIIVVVLLLVMLMKKGSAPTTPPPEPEPEPEPMEEPEEEEA